MFNKFKYLLQQKRTSNPQSPFVLFLSNKDSYNFDTNQNIYEKMQLNF